MEARETSKSFYNVACFYYFLLFYFNNGYFTRWKIHPTGTHHQSRSSINLIILAYHWVFWVAQLHAPSLRGPSQSWSSWSRPKLSPNLGPSRFGPQITPVNPQPPGDSLCPVKISQRRLVPVFFPCVQVSDMEFQNYGCWQSVTD